MTTPITSLSTSRSPASYTHTQTGWAILGVLAVAVIAAAAPIVVIGARRPALGLALATGIPLVLVIAVAGTLSRLTIEVRDDVVRWSFAFGVSRGSIALADVESVKVVRNPWLYGIGIRVTPTGMLYNVSGTDAVELTSRRGTIRLGTDEPQALLAAIQAAKRHLANTRQPF